MEYLRKAILYIKSIEFKFYFKKIVPTKKGCQNILNKCRRNKNTETSTEMDSVVNNNTNTTTNVEYINEAYNVNSVSNSRTNGINLLQNMKDDSDKNKVKKRQSNSSRSEESSSDKPNKPIGKQIINQIYEKEIAFKQLIKNTKDKVKKQTTTTSKVKEVKTEHREEPIDLAEYKLSSLNTLEMIRKQIQNKARSIKQFEGNEADIEFLLEYLNTCMLEIKAVDAKKIVEVELAKDEAMKFAKKWYDQLDAKLINKREEYQTAEDLYIENTLKEIHEMKQKLYSLSDEIQTSPKLDNENVQNDLSKFLFDIDSVDTKQIIRIEKAKRRAFQYAQALSVDVDKKNELDNKISSVVDDVDIGEVHLSLHSIDSDDKQERSSKNNNRIERALSRISHKSDNQNNQITNVKDDRSDKSFIDVTEDNNLALQLQTPPRKRKAILRPPFSKQRAVEVDTTTLKLPNKLISSTNYENTSPTKKPTVKDRFFLDINKANNDQLSEINDADYKDTCSYTEEQPKFDVPASSKKESKKTISMDVSQQVNIQQLYADEKGGDPQLLDLKNEVEFINNRLESLAEGVANFNGQEDDEEFLYLRENLTYAISALDGISPGKNSKIRDAKRKALLYGQIWYDELERKVEDINLT